MTSAGGRPLGPGADTETAGFVLAGGASRRMGTAKALLDLDGTTLVEHIVQQVVSAAGSATIIGPKDLFSHLPLTVVEDLYPGEGPLGGIITALKTSSADRNLIVACDMPNLLAASLSNLLDLSRGRDAEVTAPVTTDGWRHPLCAVYKASVLTTLEQLWSEGVRSINRALDFVPVCEVSLDTPFELASANTPAEWVAIRQRVG